MSRLGDLLLTGNYVTREQLHEALQYQKTSGGRVGNCLIRLGYIEEEILQSVLARQFGIQRVDLSKCEIDDEILRLLPRDLAVRLQIMPIGRSENMLSVAMPDPNDVLALDEVQFKTGLRIQPLLATESQIRETIDKYYGTPKELELKKVLEDFPQTVDRSSELEVLTEDIGDLDPEALERERYGDGRTIALKVCLIVRLGIAKELEDGLLLLLRPVAVALRVRARRAEDGHALAEQPHQHEDNGKQRPGDRQQVPDAREECDDNANGLHCLFSR